MKKLVLLFGLLLTAIFAFSQTLYLDPGKTISTDDSRGIPAISYSFGTTLHTAVVEVVIEGASPELFQALANGTNFKKMELKSYDSNNKLEYSFVFSDVQLIAIQFSGSNQLLTLQFSGFKMK